MRNDEVAAHNESWEAPATAGASQLMVLEIGQLIAELAEVD